MWIGISFSYCITNTYPNFVSIVADATTTTTIWPAYTRDKSSSEWTPLWSWFDRDPVLMSFLLRASGEPGNYHMWNQFSTYVQLQVQSLLSGHAVLQVGTTEVFVIVVVEFLM